MLIWRAGSADQNIAGVSYGGAHGTLKCHNAIAGHRAAAVFPSGKSTVP